MQHAHLASLSILVLGLLACSDSAPGDLLDVQPQFARCGTPPCGGPNAASAALQFDGVNDGTETPDTDALDLTTTFTIEGWIKPANPFSHQHIVSKWGGSVTASYTVDFDPGGSGEIRLVTHTPGAEPDNTFLAGSQPLQANVWQHFAYVFENGNAWLYLDGVLDAQRGGMNIPQVSATPVSLGRQKSLQGFIGNHYNGVMDEIRIWNVARSAKEIARDMDKRPSGRADGLVAYWRMNEGSGQTAADETGNGHDMQLGNTSGADAADPMWVSPGR